jgi:lysophospholipase L1-like esterase
MSEDQVRRTNIGKRRIIVFRYTCKTVALILFAFAASTISVAIAQTIYRPPVPPPENPAAVAWPRDDWYIAVQQKFDRYGGKHADIVFDGDSITNRWEITGKDMWARYADRAADFGIEGDRTENLLWRLSKGQMDGVGPKVVVLMIGTNNTGRDSAVQIAEGVKAIVADYEKRCPEAHVILMAIFPRGRTPNDPARLKVATINKQIAALADTNISFVDIGPKLLEADGTISSEMMPDFVHPTARGYAIWADAIGALVDKYAPKHP